jgi:hypothetical protein
MADKETKSRTKFEGKTEEGEKISGDLQTEISEDGICHMKINIKIGG